MLAVVTLLSNLKEQHSFTRALEGKEVLEKSLKEQETMSQLKTRKELEAQIKDLENKLAVYEEMYQPE